MLDKRNKVIAALFALFLGGVGIHKFYLGEWIWGIFYILFCWTGIPSIVAFVEAIIYLCTSNYNFDKKYNPGLYDEGDED